MVDAVVGVLVVAAAAEVEESSFAEAEEVSAVVVAAAVVALEAHAEKEAVAHDILDQPVVMIDCHQMPYHLQDSCNLCVYWEEVLGHSPYEYSDCHRLDKSLQRDLEVDWECICCHHRIDPVGLVQIAGLVDLQGMVLV